MYGLQWLLEDVEKDQVRERIPPLAAELHDQFQRCRHCGRVYWKGSHYRRMVAWIQELISDSSAGPSVR